MELRASCRTAALVIFLGTCVTVSAQEPSINLTVTATGLGKAVDQIANQAGKKMTVSPTLEKEPVVLRLKGVPLQEVMDKICYEFVAEWVPTKDGVELTRTNKVVDEFEKQLAAQRLAGYRESLKDLEKLASSAPMDETEAKRIAVAYAKMLSDEKNGTAVGDGIGKRTVLANRTGDMRLLAKMILAVGVDRIAMLPLGRVIFSIDPTQMQSAINGLSASDFEEYLQQRNLLSKEVTAALPKDVHDGYGDSAMFSARESLKAPIKPLLQCYGDPSSDGTWIQMLVYDSAGASVAATFAIGDAYKPAEYTATRGKTLVASKDEKELQLDPELVSLATRYFGRGQKIEPLSAKGLEILTHPEDFEPFSLYFSDILLAQAERENRNLIASGADRDLRVARLSPNGSIKPSAYELSVTTFKRITYERPDGWLIVRSKNPVSATDTRLDRHALGEFARAWKEQGYASIEDWAELAKHVTRFDDGTLAYMYHNLLRGERSMNYSNDWETLRLYGTLSDTETSQLAGGMSVPVHTLPSVARDSINWLIYNNQSVRARPSSAPINQSQFSEDESGRILPGIEHEPTESVPNGVPPNAHLRAQLIEKQLLFAKEGGMHRSEREIEIPGLAALLVQVQDGPPISPDYKLLGVRMGSKRTIIFQVPLTDRIQMSSALREDHFDTPDFIPVDQLKDRLPAKVWEEIAKQMAQTRELRKRYGNGDPFPNEPPPVTPPPTK